MHAYGTPRVDVDFTAIARRLAEAIPGAHALGEPGSPLEALPAASDPPRTIGARVIEGTTLRARRIIGDPVPGLSAFLDGVQRSHPVLYLPGGIPVVLGIVAAVIRERRNRRFATWRVRKGRRLYAPRFALPGGAWDCLEALSSAVGLLPPADSSPPEPGVSTSAHPFVHLDRALHSVQHDRELAEQALAEEWCGLRSETLGVDGGISGSERVARSVCAVGIVKTHRTLYADPQAIATVIGLRRGERSSAFRVTSPRRANVASWYLRLRDAEGRDPLFGLVRIEIADADDVGARADEVSCWILAEIAPVAMPDARWDRMLYGVRDCEEFLSAVL